MSGKKYNNCPITEAVFNVKVTLEKEFDFNVFEAYAKEIIEEYPIKELSINFKDSEKGVPNGFMFKNSEENRVVQFRSNGFSFHQLKPYDGWEKFSGEAKKHLARFMEFAASVSVDKVGIRYLNKIEIPLPFESLAEYITTGPTIGDGIEDAMSHFFMRIVIPKRSEDFQCTAVVTQTIDTSEPIKEKMPLIFDIDVSKKIEKEILEDELDDTFNRMRDFKNVLFESSITEKTRKIFE